MRAIWTTTSPVSHCFKNGPGLILVRQAGIDDDPEDPPAQDAHRTAITSSGDFPGSSQLSRILAGTGGPSGPSR